MTRIPSRRSLSRALALLLVTGTLAACGREEARGETPGAAAPQTVGAAAQVPEPLDEESPALFTEEPAPAAAGDTIDLRKVGYDRGSPRAPVVVMEFADFGCPFCSTFALSTYPELHKEFVATGKVRWKYVPFVMGMFPNGSESAKAGECAAEQGKFWAMHDLLYQKQREWKASRAPEPLFRGYARGLGLSDPRFAACYRENRGGARTALNNRISEQLRVRATPTFFVNGQMIEGALPLEQFRQVLRQAGGE